MKCRRKKGSPQKKVLDKGGRGVLIRLKIFNLRDGGIQKERR